MTPAPNVWAIHERACRRGSLTYDDPATGCRVFTAHGLMQRGRCCGCGCRHCPYAHQAVPVGSRGQRIHQPAWLTAPPEPEPAKTVLFWSGGKDSFLAYRALLRKQSRHSIVALTTFDGTTRRVAHQEVSIEAVASQAQGLGLPLVGVPLLPGRDYVTQVTEGIMLARKVSSVAFGDLHLEHIRRWRERAFTPLQASLAARLEFPLWLTDYRVLLRDLEDSGATCRLSAIEHPALRHLQVGDPFDRALVESLPPGVDGFGEHGEFHTIVEPPCHLNPPLRRRTA